MILQSFIYSQKRKSPMKTLNCILFVMAIIACFCWFSTLRPHNTLPENSISAIYRQSPIFLLLTKTSFQLCYANMALWDLLSQDRYKTPQLYCTQTTDYTYNIAAWEWNTGPKQKCAIISFFHPALITIPALLFLFSI